MARFAPRSFASSTARSTAALAPDKTTCPPPLSLAAAQTPTLAASAAIALTSPSSRPISAAIAPAPTATAFCMARPRMRNSRAASAIESARAAASAEYSPSECPATKARVALEIDSGFLLKRAQRRKRDRHQRRLGIFSQRQRIGRPVPDDVAEPFAQRSYRPLRKPAAPMETRRPRPCPYRRPDCPGREKQTPPPYAQSPPENSNCPHRKGAKDTGMTGMSRMRTA